MNVADATSYLKLVAHLCVAYEHEALPRGRFVVDLWEGGCRPAQGMRRDSVYERASHLLIS